MTKTWKETKNFIRQDFYRNLGAYRKSDVLKAYLFASSTVSLLLHYRICNYYCNLDRKNPFQVLRHCISYAKFKKAMNRCGIEMNQHTEIGYGLRFPHKGNIVIHPLSVIGNNCEIMQGVTIGNNILKDRDKVATIGNDVMLCAGAKIIGNVSIGNNVIVGANAVVTHDIIDDVIVAGIPAREIGKCDGSHVINCLIHVKINDIR